MREKGHQFVKKIEQMRGELVMFSPGSWFEGFNVSRNKSEGIHLVSPSWLEKMDSRQVNGMWQKCDCPAMRNYPYPEASLPMNAIRGTFLRQHLTAVVYLHQNHF
jgi:hypothetical protein